MGIRKLLITVAILALAAAPQAFASVSSVPGRGILNVKANPGEANRITIGYVKGIFTIADSGPTVKAGKRCARRPKRKVRCDARIPKKDFIGSMRAWLGDGDDRLTVKPAKREGFVTVYSGSGNDVVKAGPGFGFGYFYGERGDDVIEAGAKDSEIQGDSGADKLTGGAGRDNTFGGDDADRLDGGAGNDRFNGNAGNDTVLGGGGNDLLGVSSDEDTEVAEYNNSDPGADVLDGGSGDDSIGGLDGGQAAPDQITCGPGNDFALADQLDIVAADCERVTRIQSQ